MSQTSPTPSDETLTFKVASEPDEFEQIYRLNYRTFVEEIPQHAPNGDGVLVDKFDPENIYFICRRGDRVIGMLTMRTKRPWSLDAKIENLDSYLPSNLNFCECRLLAVEPEYRTGVVMTGLIHALSEHSRVTGYDAAVISATVRQIKLYKHMGFVPFGPLVGTPDALFQPMYLTRENFSHILKLGRVRASDGNGAAPSHSNGGPATLEPKSTVQAVRERAEQENFLPGPVPSHPDVWAAFTRPPVSHRHPDFAVDLATTQQLLKSLVRAERVQLLVGSGTLANDAIAAQLTLLDKPGVVLTNGEFGDRLVDHAVRTGLKHAVVRAEWGDVLPMQVVSRVIANLQPGAWCWMVHCETSSGILNDMQGVAELCKKHSVHLAADCVSSLATVPLDLREVYLASGVSGKAVAALPGLSMVFHHHEINPSDRLPRYLDLGYYAAKHSVPFTHSSNLLAALRVATERTTRRAPFTDVAELGQWLRGRLRELRFNVVAPEAHAAPGVVTLAIPGDGKGTAFGDRMADAGYELSYRSDYLRRRDWVQIALMGDCRRDRLERLLKVLTRVYAEVVA